MQGAYHNHHHHHTDTIVQQKFRNKQGKKKTEFCSHWMWTERLSCQFTIGEYMKNKNSVKHSVYIDDIYTWLSMCIENMKKIDDAEGKKQTQTKIVRNWTNQNEKKIGIVMVNFHVFFEILPIIIEVKSNKASLK